MCVYIILRNHGINIVTMYHKLGVNKATNNSSPYTGIVTHIRVDARVCVCTRVCARVILI